MFSHLPTVLQDKIANALLGLAAKAFVAAQSQRSRAPRPTRRCWPRTPRTPRSPPARPRSRAAACAMMAARPSKRVPERHVWSVTAVLWLAFTKCVKELLPAKSFLKVG